MRIAFVYDAVYPYVLGGVEKRVWEIARRLAAQEHEVHIYGMHFWEGDRRIVCEGVVIHGICRPYTFYRKGKRRIWPVLVYGVKVFFTFLKERFDIVDCQQFPYISALAVAISCRISRSPLIITWHEVWGNYWYDYLGLSGSVGKALERIVARVPAHMIVISETTRIGLTGLVSSRDMKIIPNGIDLAEIDSILPAETKSDILFVGRLIREKHVDVLIDAVEILRKNNPGIRCLIIGDGPERIMLETKVRNLGMTGNIIFTGFLKGSRDIIAHMKSSTVFVLPSTREGFGISALEALAAGLPVVTIDHPKNASRMFVRNGCGALSTLDAQDLSEKMHAILKSGAYRECSKIAREYDWGIITDIVEDYYFKISEREMREC